MRVAWMGGLVVVAIAACKKDPPPEPAVVDAAADATVDGSLARVAPPALKLPPTPGALARFPDAPLMQVVALGERRVLLAKTNAEAYDREKDGAFKVRGIRNEWPQLRAVVAVPASGGEAVEIAQTHTEVSDHSCADAADFVWVDEVPEGATTIQIVAIDGDAPRTLLRLPPDTKVDRLSCRANAVLAVLSDQKDGGPNESRLVSIDKTDGTMKALASGIASAGDFSSSSTLTSDQVNVYWYERKSQSRAIKQVPLAGGAVTTRLKMTDASGHLEFSFHDFEANATGVYWLGSAMSGSFLHRVAPGKRDAQSIGDRPVSALHGGFYDRDGEIVRLSDDGASLVKVAEGAGAMTLGCAVRGNRAVMFVHVHGDDASEPGELHLVQRTLEDTQRDR